MTSQEIKEKILIEISKTENLIAEYQEMIKPITPDVAIGRVSRMDAIVGNAVTESALRQAQEKLKKLNYVLSKVDSADFGICLRCKSPIPIGRILFRPESVHCVNCAK